MNIRELLATTEHRNYAPPTHGWMFYQEWHDLLFLHWAVDPDVLAEYLPSGLEPDTYDGVAYVSLVPFRMANVRPRGLPAFPPLSNFYEFNYRTYARRGNESAVYFFSLEADKRLPVLLAKRLSGLPYSYADIRRTEREYVRTNRAGDHFSCAFTPGAPLLEKTDLDRWLTERYALFLDKHDGSIVQLEVHHPEWPLQEVQIDRLEVRSTRYDSLTSGQPALAHYTAGVPVLTWG